VTAPAVADEVAAAADLVKGKLTRSPVAVLSGLGHLVMAVGEHGPGAAALVRDEGSDMFGYGAREAVLAAVGRPGDGRGFGAPATAEELRTALMALVDGAVPVRLEAGRVTVHLDQVGARAAGMLVVRTEAVARAHGWRVAWNSAEDLGVFSPNTP
jgi:coenzyme F420-0:L-glutamate ligase/coenzyme F420-1:gamma-L-glutamate ligase